METKSAAASGDQMEAQVIKASDVGILDLDHPALKPATKFVEGEEVMTAKGPGKISAIDTRDGTYTVQYAATEKFAESAISKKE